MSPASITKIRSDREARAHRHLELAKVLCHNPDATNIELAKALNVSRNTITTDRLAIMNEVNRNALTETQQYREHQLARIADKWDSIEESNMNDAEKHREWRGWMKLEVEIRGTAAPTKSISANMNIEQQVIPIEQQLEYLNAFAGLYEDERLQELDRVKARKRTCRIVMDANVFQRQLEESCGS